MPTESFAPCSPRRRPGKITLGAVASRGAGWKDAGFLPRTDERSRAEHTAAGARAAESLASGTPNGRSGSLSQPRGDRRARRPARGEGIPVTRRSTFLLVGAVNEDEATALAERAATRFRRARASRSSRAAPWSGRSATQPVRRLRRARRLTTFLPSATLLRPGTATRGGRQWKLPVRPSRAVPTASSSSRVSEVTLETARRSRSQPLQAQRSLRLFELHALRVEPEPRNRVRVTPPTGSRRPRGGSAPWRVCRLCGERRADRRGHRPASFRRRGGRSPGRRRLGRGCGRVGRCGRHDPCRPRAHTAFSRRGAGEDVVEQVLAANVDVVFVVSGRARPQPPTQAFLAAAWESGLGR